MNSTFTHGVYLCICQRPRRQRRLETPLLALLLSLGIAVSEAATVLYKSANATVYLGLPLSSVEFENPLSGTETVLGHPVLDWRDADYQPLTPPPYDDWNASNPATTGGDANHVFMWARDTFISTTTTKPSSLVSVHLDGDFNDGIAQVLVDGTEVARLDMNNPTVTTTVLVLVNGLANALHTIQVTDLGASSANPDVHMLGAAALGPSPVKWDQPPVPTETTNIFYGWNQHSMYFMPPYAADDWVCTSANPVTKIRWWGSFIGWTGQTLPQPAPLGFQVAYWTDVPAVAGGFSHPGTVLQTNFCSTYTATWVGWDYDPRTGAIESCFLFEQALPQGDWFYQNPGANGTNIFWLSIAAAYPPGAMGPPWGWKTRPRDVTSPAPDAAVMIHAPPLIEPGATFVAGDPLWWPDPTVQWDLAFELVSEYSSEAAKYVQPPETFMGIDVNATWRPASGVTNLLADDFPCTQTGPLTQITIWGSWTNDLVPLSPSNVRFTLSIHKDIPASQSPTGYSMPGQVLWTNLFLPGQFRAQVEFQTEEGWLNPPANYVFPGDHTCYRYDFTIPAAQAFVQQGTPAQPAIYWLDVQAQPLGTDTRVRFGWKTTPVIWMDNAVWVKSTEPYSGTGWVKLTYPLQHPRAGQPLNLAFQVATSQQVSETKWSQPPQLYVMPDAFNGWNEPSVVETAGADGQIVADDWVCTNAMPVTDIHWWGSYLGYSQPTPPGVEQGFWISIWSDVPAQPGGWSHPGQVLWTYFTHNYAVNFAGWDIDPRSNSVPEACFRYDLELPEEYWFRQAPGTNIYWISVAAVMPQTELVWGWKTRPHDPLSPAPDAAVRVFDPTLPNVGDLFVSGLPIRFPLDHSWDTAFTLTTRELGPQLDFGDAPDAAAAPRYPTLLGNDGARHLIAPTVYLGARVDAEADGQPTANADGDDLNPPAGLDDEDGVTLNGPFVPGHAASVTLQASVAGFFSLWIDYHADGTWLTPGDQVFSAQPISAGSSSFNFNVPLTAKGGTNTYARVRFCTTATPITSPTGQAPDGEVEDYWLHLEQLDYGDAPDPTYPTYLTNNGARHIVGPMFLGRLIDAESNGQPDATATGDDLNPPLSLSDEDGVVFHTALIARVPNTITVTTSIGGYLQGWIDLNADGDWADAGEQVIADRPLGPGANSVTFSVSSLTNAPKTIARFRLSGLTGLGITGLAPDGEVEDYEVKIEPLKWVQEPEVGSEGVDVDNQWTLADDFQCTQSGPITDFHIWGSFRGDRLPQGDPGNMTITLTLYSDVPAGTGNPYSHPGSVLWQRTFAPGQFTAALCTRTSYGEWWFNPAQPPPIFPGDTNIYQFDFYVDRTNSFTQVEGTIYWLGMQYIPQGGTTLEFGWKTTFRNSWNDDACWLDTRMGGAIWRELVYLSPHPRAGTSMDLAFALSGEAGEVLDFGDAPDPVTGLGYPTRLLNNGARHRIVSGMRLGALIDAEANGQPDASATGDDLGGLADEDGVVFNTQLFPGQNATVTVTATAPGLLNAWLDFGADRSWGTAGDQIFTNVALNPGANALTFRVPATAVCGTNTFARFRYSTVANLSFTGAAHDGEVEDYQVHLECLDFGDAPDPSYPTLLANSGARHVIGPMFLGKLIDAEADGQPNATATGDDLIPAGADDEDGVVFHTALIALVPNTITVTTSIGGYLQGWIDLNADGDWADANEQVIVDRLLGPGANSVTFTVASLTNAPKTFARFRLSGLTGLGYTGLAPDGEVEDYEIKIQPLKWVQEPEIGSEGVDVDNQWTLADDFQCTQSGPITDFHIWGSFRGDRLPLGGPTNMSITLMIYSDVPAGPNNPYSHPGTVLWQRSFAPGTFDAALCTRTSDGEWWFNPAQPPPFFPGDTNIYQFDFYVDRAGAFTQAEGTIYWLGMKYQPGGGTSFDFGWKTTFRNSWNDDACWLDTRSGLPTWRELAYLPPHPKAGTSLDLAFALSGEPGQALDFGDAPDSLVLPRYPTLLANNGARHTLVPTMFLGTLLDSENDGQPNLTATGDDLAALADEDGVAFGPQLVPGLPATVQVTASVAGYLNAWLDSNGDGNWTTAGDQIITAQPINAGTTTLNFTVPGTASAGITTLARFRFSSVSNLTYAGSAPDGEVEDYQVRFGTPPESDLGDAPDSSNSHGAAYPMTAYTGVNAAFPTVFGLGSPPFGPLHRTPKGRAHLGLNVSGEAEADIGTDMDLINNLDPVNNLANRDGAEDGVVFPLSLPHGKPTTLTVNVKVVVPGPTMFLNVWYDWNRDGDWNDTLASPNGAPAPEWAVQNLPVPIPAIGTFAVVTPPFVCWQPGPQVSAIWVRATLSETAWPGPPGWSGAGGDGAPAGFDFGETEDYLVTDYYQNSDLDFGDAPDVPYRTVLARNGARHAIVPNFSLGAFLDAEPNGQPDAAATGDDLNPPAGPDDEDGVTLVGWLVRGRMATIRVFLTGPAGRLDAWVDWRRNGNWTDPGDKILHNQPLMAGNNVLTFPVPATARVGETYSRFRLSSIGGLGDTNLWHDGEVEDYRLTVYQRRPLPFPITNLTVIPFIGGQIARVAWLPEADLTYELWGTSTLSNSPPTWSVIGEQVDWPQNWQWDTNVFQLERYYRVVVPYTEP
jgi:hypothetical protein